MARSRFLLAILVVSSAALVSSTAIAAWTHDPSVNLLVSGGVGSQSNPVAASDGQGGAFVAWVDSRNFGSTNYDVYAQHVLSTGVVDPAWPVNGLAICALAGEQSIPAIVSDGAGGMIVAWQDHRGSSFDIYAQRISSAGTVVAPWPANGKQITNSSFDDYGPRIVTDGANGAWIAWTRDFGGGDLDPVVNHVLANATTQIGFGFDIDAATSTQSGTAIASDDSGGCFVAYHTNASGNFDIKVLRIAVNGTAPWNTVVASAAAGDQTNPVAADDTHGGVFIAWSDARGGSGTDIFGMRILANGVRAPGWIGDGSALASGAGATGAPLAMVPDGAGGEILAYDQCSFFCYCYLQRVAPSGLVYWTPPGYSLPGGVIGAGCEVGDGTGGAIAAGDAYVGGGFIPNVTASHATTGGATATGWDTPSETINNSGATASYPVAVTDGKGGAIVVWADFRNGVDFDVFAQRIERFGRLGNPEPSIVNVKDVPNDQGGKVDVKWNASYLDAAPDMTIYDYRIWRQAPPSTAQQAIAHGAIVLDDAVAARIDAESRAQKSDALAGSARRVFRRSIEGAQVNYWELIGTQVAAQLPAYSFGAATNSDSIGASNPRTLFYVDAYSGYQTHWDSAPDSGYSVDNLPPVAPSPFTATFSPPNGTFAAWGANGESDLAGYRLYRGGGLGFTPSPANRIYDGTVPSYHDVTSTAFIYKVCAYDIHGNEGGCSTAQPPGTTDVGEEMPKVLSLASVDPNPSRDGANLRFGLPHDGRVTVTIYDAQGRRVRTVVDAWLPAGFGLTRWDGRNNAGDDSGSGIYFARLDAGGQRITRRFVRVE
jgi:hypothetical protein